MQATSLSRWIALGLAAHALLLVRCGGGDSGEDCRGYGRYEVGKEGGYRPCCPELTQIATLTAAYGPGAVVVECQEAIVNTYACIEGACGDGVCEGPEEDCGCIADCGGPGE